MAKLRLAYSHLNLRWNPFGEISQEDVAQLAVVQVEQYVERLNHPGFALQFLGEPGRGKTTHILKLHDYYPEAPYLHFRENADIPAIPQAPLLFLDETQRLPRSLRRQVFSRQASFVIGTHYDHARELQKAGKVYNSIHLRGITRDHLETVIQRRIEWARRNPGPVPVISIGRIDQLIQEYGDDLLRILHQLYEEFQVLEENRDGYSWTSDPI
jgi:hypothetical protein